MPLPLIIGLVAPLIAKAIPALVGHLFGDKGEEIAEKVIETAKEITGIDKPEEAVAAIEKDPKLFADFQVRMEEIGLEYYKEDTKRYDIYHQTIRADITSQDSYNRRWRATFGYCVSFSWALMFLTLFLGFVGTFISMIVMDDPPVDLVDVCTAWGALASATIALWGIALTILGVNIKKRSDDKKVATGEIPKGYLESLVGLIKK